MEHPMARHAQRIRPYVQQVSGQMVGAAKSGGANVGTPSIGERLIGKTTGVRVHRDLLVTCRRTH